MKPSALLVRFATIALTLLPLGCLTPTREKKDRDADKAALNDPGAGTSAIEKNPPASTCPEGLVDAEMPERALLAADGWAGVSALGLDRTTGGAQGEVVVARSLVELRSYLSLPEPLVVKVCGQLGDESSVGQRINIESTDKTLIGVGTRPTLMASVALDGASNIIVRDLYLRGASPDGIGIRQSHHVWVDHVDISDSADGNLDITEQSDYVTVSWSRFYYTDQAPDPNHRFSNLIGSSDSATEDEGRLRVTFHHNWWADNVHERMPRVRFGDVHLYNNYYSAHGNHYCVRTGFHADVLIEQNYFNRVGDPWQNDGASAVTHRGNLFVSAAAGVSVGTSFEPPYEAVLHQARQVPSVVMEGSGPLRLSEVDPGDDETDDEDSED